MIILSFLFVVLDKAALTGLSCRLLGLDTFRFFEVTEPHWI